MAVKVMWAPALRAEVADEPKSVPTAAATTTLRRPEPVEKPKRRRSSVYDAEGNEVFLTLMCLKCHQMRPLSQFGLRRMADGAIRNQPWCRTCRSEASPKRRKDGPAAVVGEPTRAPEERTVTAPRDAGFLAAQVAAALHRGRG